MSQTSLQRGNLFWEASLATSTCCKVCQPRLEKPSHCKCGLQLMTNQLLIPGVDSPVAFHWGCNLGAWCLCTPLLQRCRCHSDVPCWHRAAHWQRDVHWHEEQRCLSEAPWCTGRMIPAAQLLGSPCQWFALQREGKESLRQKLEVKSSLLNLSMYRVRLSYQAAILASKALLEINGEKEPFPLVSEVPLQQGKQDEGQTVAFVFMGFHRTSETCPLSIPSLLPKTPSHFGYLMQLHPGSD